MKNVGFPVAILSLLASAAWAAPALQVQQADGKALVRATAARLAAWRPEADALVVVVPAASGAVEIGKLPQGVTADKLAQGGLAGVVLHGVDGSWQVVQDGANWLIRPGAGLKPESIMMLRDGWHVGHETLMPQTIMAAGKTWDVALVDSAVGVAGSVAGAVRVKGDAVLTAEMVAPVKAADKEPEKVAEKVIEKPMPVAAPMPALRTVAVEDTDSLRPVAAPMMAAVPLPAKTPATAKDEPMQVANLSDMLSRIEPAAGEVSPAAAPAAPLALPQSGLAKVQVAAVASATTPEPTRGGGLGKVAIHAAPSMKAIGVSGVAAEVLPQILTDIYMPGTVISLTLPGMEEDKAPEEHGAAGQVSGSDATAAANVSGSWNQTVLDPMATALAELKTSPSLAVSAVLPKGVASTEREVAPLALTRILPARGSDYNDDISDALQAIVIAPDKSTRARDGEMNLAGLYLAWQRPEEALGVLDNLPKRADGLPTSPQARLYVALAQLARGQVPDAGLFDQGGQLGGHAKLWKAVAASRAGDYATAMKLWPQERGILPQYPAYLREQAQMAQATALVMVGDRETAIKVIDELIDGYSDADEVPVGLKRLRGLARLGTPDEAKGLEYLAAAAEDMRDPAEAYRAKFQFVRALQQRHDLSDEQVRTYLSDLWYDWRGDDLERDVLNTLAELYDKAGESRDALQYWQTLVRAYPKATDLNHVTEQMTEAFLKVFDPENPKVYDALAYVGLYYDFSELVPNDARGDAVQEQVARLLVNANLWNRAVPILEQQLDHRPLDPAAQGRLALLLAESYGNLNKAADGIKILDKWEHVATTQVLAREWKLQEADLMMKLSRPEAATKALAGLPADDLDARRMRIEAAWAAKDWSGSVPLLQAQLANVPASQLVSDTGAQLATFRLGYAYGQLHNGEALDLLTKRYGDSLSRLPQLADDVGAVAAGTGVSASIVAAGPLAPLTGALNDINRLTDRVAQMRTSMAEQRAQQKEYNDKMRYMELLPPPAI